MSGSPFRAVVAAPIAAFVLHGQPKSYVKTAQSGNRRTQVFCPECGTPLYATAPENPTSVIIRLGCVAQRALLKPAVQIWQHSALPWLSELPSIPGSPEQQAFLPPFDATAVKRGRNAWRLPCLEKIELGEGEMYVVPKRGCATRPATPHLVGWPRPGRSCTPTIPAALRHRGGIG